MSTNCLPQSQRPIARPAIMGFAALFLIGGLTACGAGQEEEAAVKALPPQAVTVMACANVAALSSSLVTSITNARDAAQRDCNLNCNKNTVAPQYNLDSLNRALVIANHSQSYVQSQPSPISYAAAYNPHVWAMQIAQELPTATHWAQISVAYFGSNDAYASFTGGIDARNLATQLDEQSSKCYMSAYYPVQ